MKKFPQNTHYAITEWDEAYQLHGPFETENEATRMLHTYVDEMLGGDV